MTLKVFCVFDSKVEAYMQPFFMKSRGEAIRGFTEVVNDPKTSIHKWPADYTLFELGSWDESKAKFELLSTPYSLGVGLEFVKEKPVLECV